MADRRPSLATWQTLLVLTLAAATVLSLLAGAVGLVLVVMDERTHSDDWDGLGTLIGLVILALAALGALLYAALWALAVAGRRRAQEGDPRLLRVSAIVAAVVGGLGLVPLVLLTPTLGTSLALWLVPALLGVALLSSSVQVARDTWRGADPDVMRSERPGSQNV